jgi:hypothetical protein
MTSSKVASRFWMRPVSFAGLLRILQLVAEFPGGLRARDLDALVRERQIRLTRKDVAPARTTLYHYRNTLLHLQALRRDNRRLLTNTQNPCVQILLAQPSPDNVTLNTTTCEAFATLVLQNEDCKTHFFNLFMPGTDTYTVQQFRTAGCSVTWRWQGDEHSREVVFQNDHDKPLHLQSPSETKSILYGLRYWARDELRLIDEFFREDRGSIMYPIFATAGEASTQEIIRRILSLRPEGAEWTTFSLHDLAVSCCEQRRQPLAKLFDAIAWLSEKYPGHVVLIPTSRSFATFTAPSRQREEFELRGYFRDRQGRYISHVRLHSSIGRLGDVYTPGTAGA